VVELSSQCASVSFTFLWADPETGVGRCLRYLQTPSHLASHLSISRSPPVAFVYSADPLQAKFCHCEDCQRLHGAPFQHAAVFEKDKVRLDSDTEWIGFLR
jgi:hypothetical protein